MGNSQPKKKVPGRWKHLIVCPDRGLFHGLTAILAEVTPGASFVDLKTYPARRALADAFNAEQPNLCFLDVGSSWDSAETFMNDVSSISATTPVVAICGRNDPDLILRSLRGGASEFLFQPFAIEQIGVALDRLARLQLTANIESRELGKVFCVMPGKGASGATTVACNLAFQFQKADTKKKVLLADLDPSTGTLSFLLKLKSSYSFVDALVHSSQMDEDLWKGLVTPQHGVDVILSPDSPVDHFPSREAAAMIEYSRENYGAVILDTASPFGEWAGEVAQLCDELILVTTNELPALHSTQKALAHLEHIGIERSKVKLVVNRYHPDLGLDRTAIQTALNLDIFLTLPNDVDAIQKSLLEGKPVVASSALGKQFVSMARSLGSGAKGAEAKRSSLFSGIFNVFQGVLHR